MKLTSPEADNKTISKSSRNIKYQGYIDKIFHFVVTAIALTAVVTIFLIFIFIAKEALPIFTDNKVQESASIEKLFLPQVFPDREDPIPVFIWQPVSDTPKFSVLPLIVGSIKATIVGILFAAPLAILAAIYTSQFASPWFRETVKPMIELLAGIPSVVLGFFALMVMATWFQNAFGFQYRLNGFTAGIALGIAVIPIIYTIAEDAFNTVPKSYKEASLALGANPMQTTWRVVFPSVLPGIFAAIVLGFGRAVGETMIVLMASGNASILSANFADSLRTISATIAAELGEVIHPSIDKFGNKVPGDTHYTVLFFLGSMLFIFTFALNYLGDIVVHRLKKQLSGTK